MKRIELIIKGSGEIVVGLAIQPEKTIELEQSATVRSIDAALAVAKDLVESDGNKEFDDGFRGKKSKPADFRKSDKAKSEAKTVV